MPIKRIAAMAFVLLAAACNGVVDVGPTESLSESLEFTETVNSVRIDNPAGDIEIEGSESDVTTIERTIRFTGDDPPDATAAVNGERLELDVDCGLRRRCEVDYVMTVPADATLDIQVASSTVATRNMTAAVNIDSASGSVRVTEVTGDVRIASASGSIRLTDITGDLDINAASGSVDGTGLRSGQVEVDVASGSVDLTFADAVDSLVVGTASGSVTVRVPGGPYRVETDSSSGNIDVNIATDPAADRSINIDTASGGITIDPA